jgi:hypothetical protein
MKGCGLGFVAILTEGLVGSVCRALAVAVGCDG